MDTIHSIMQGKISTQDKIVNALPFIAFLTIVAIGIVFVFTM